jgi:hypothetical protein
MSLIRTLAIALAFAAVAVPTAQAKFVDIHQPLIEQSMPPCPQNFSRNPATKECLSPFATVKVPAPAPAPSPSAPAAEPSGGGIDWEDAGIGAGGTLAMVLLAGGGAMTLANRRRGLRTAA